MAGAPGRGTGRTGREPAALRRRVLRGRQVDGGPAVAGHLGAPLLALDEIYPGWDGLAAAPAIARDGIGDPLAAGTTLRWPTWDWDAGRPGPWREHPPAPVVVLEGCGTGARVLAPVTALLVWVDADAVDA